MPRLIHALTRAVGVLALLAIVPPSGIALASHVVPGGATSVAVSLVNNYRQTINTTQCVNRGGVLATHRAPLAYRSCIPPATEPGTVAALGTSSSDSTIRLTTLSNDIAIVADIDGVICLRQAPGCSAAGAPYDTPPDSTFDYANADVTATIKMRFNDHASCPGQQSCPEAEYVQPATMTDIEYPVPIDCDTNGSCQASTTLNAIVPDAFRSGERNNVQVFRVRVRDSGLNGVRADVDDNDFAMQGLLVP
jgi:hypothetical protein